MVVQSEEVVDCANMCIDDKSHRPGFPSIKFRLREERKKVISISSTKYYNIEDHEIGMRRFCLIRNTLSRLQHEEREEKLARHRASSPSESYDMEVDDALNQYDQPAPSPITALSDDEDDLPPCKRPRLSMDDDRENDKENSCEDRLIDVVGDKDESCSMEEAQNILRDAYESYTGERISQSRLSSQALTITPCSNISNCSTNTISCNSSPLSESNSSIDLSLKSKHNTSNIYFDNEGCICLSGYRTWSRPQHQYPCRYSSLFGNDLKSVVYQSLITSL